MGSSSIMHACFCCTCLLSPVGDPMYQFCDTCFPLFVHLISRQRLVRHAVLLYIPRYELLSLMNGLSPSYIDCLSRTSTVSLIRRLSLPYIGCRTLSYIDRPSYIDHPSYIDCPLVHRLSLVLRLSLVHRLSRWQAAGRAFLSYIESRWITEECIVQVVTAFIRQDTGDSQPSFDPQLPSYFRPLRLIYFHGTSFTLYTAFTDLAVRVATMSWMLDTMDDCSPMNFSESHTSCLRTESNISLRWTRMW